jgi:TPR repeat protein
MVRLRPLLALLPVLALGACRSPLEPTLAEQALLAPAAEALERGDGARALDLYLALAEDGMPYAQYEVARLYEDGLATRPDPEAALRWYRAAAEAGLPAAELHLAQMYERGDGVKRDPLGARRLYESAAASGVGAAHLALGQFAEWGIDGTEDMSAARRHYEAAAALGEVEAKIALARLLGMAGGSGPPAAEAWAESALRDLRAAANAGDGAAMEYLGKLYLRGEIAPLRIDEARRWLRAAAEAGRVEAAVTLARLLRDGTDGLEPAPAEAAALFEMAARAGDAGARYDLARLYVEGRGVPQDGVRAAALFRGAVAGGERRALRALGDLYAQGIDVPPDAAEAGRWYEAAARQGDTEALLALGDMYEHGRGVAADPILALKWYELAASAGHHRAGLRAKRLRASLDPGEAQRAVILAEDWQLSGGGQSGFSAR